jgi:hypothetical protein
MPRCHCTGTITTYSIYVFYFMVSSVEIQYPGHAVVLSWEHCNPACPSSLWSASQCVCLMLGMVGLCSELLVTTSLHEWVVLLHQSEEIQHSKDNQTKCVSNNILPTNTIEMSLCIFPIVMKTYDRTDIAITDSITIITEWECHYVDSFIGVRNVSWGFARDSISYWEKVCSLNPRYCCTRTIASYLILMIK